MPSTLLIFAVRDPITFTFQSRIYWLLPFSFNLTLPFDFFFFWYWFVWVIYITWVLFIPLSDIFATIFSHFATSPFPFVDHLVTQVQALSPKLLFWSCVYFCWGDNSDYFWFFTSDSNICYWGITHIPQFSSVAQSCLTPWDPMDGSTPGLPVYHQLTEFTPTHVHRIGDAIQPSHPLSSPSPPAPNPSQHQGFFQWVNSLHQVATVLEFQL